MCENFGRLHGRCPKFARLIPPPLALPSAIHMGIDVVSTHSMLGVFLAMLRVNLCW
jgi:hypothetical protein